MLANCWNQKILPNGVKMALVGAVALVSSLAMSVEKAEAADLIVYYDQAQLLRLPRPVAEIIIGNPSIADVTVQGGNTLVVTGKTFGLTNIIALDAERNIIQDQRIIVERDEKNIVNLTRAGLRRSFTCTSSCAPTLTIGDDEGYFANVNSQNSIKTEFSEKVGGSNGNGNQ